MGIASGVSGIDLDGYARAAPAPHQDHCCDENAKLPHRASPENASPRKDALNQLTPTNSDAS
jgi:hypothetical protein